MDEVARIREKTDVVALVSEYIPLKKLGKNFKTTCPFHNEKTPSFVVSPERQIWHCFGCGKGGDAYTFLMEYEKLEFVEALRILAKKTGVELQESDFVKKGSSQKEKIYKINSLSSEYYHYILMNHSRGRDALNYLTKKRKVDSRLIETFKIGYSPSVGNALTKYLIEKKKYKVQDLVDAGISVFRSGRLSDFFRNRLMFPIYDHRDNIVAFSGRVLSDQIKESKYVNTRDTLAYHKGSMFFGLNIAKDEIKSKDQAIIVEGEFDVISLFSEGIKNTIAIKGTALTEDQVSLIARFASKITLCLDKDEAGFEAIKRSLASLEKKGLAVTTVEFGEYKDPDEAVKNDPIFFKKQLKNDIGIYDYLISAFLEKHDESSAIGKKKIGENLLPFISLIENEIVKEHYLKLLSDKIDTSFENLMIELDKIVKKQTIGTKFTSQKKEKRTRKEILEEYLLALLIQLEDKEKIIQEVSNTLSDYQFESPAFQKIFEWLRKSFANEKSLKIKDMVKSLSQELMPVFDTCFLLPIPKFENNEKYLAEASKMAKETKTLFIKSKIRKMSLDINRREKSGDEIKSLEKELIALSKTVNQLNSASKT